VGVRVCASCGNEFEDRSRTSPRSYCYECKPLPGQQEIVVPGQVAGEPFTVEHFREWALGLTLDNGESWVVEEFFLAFLADFFAGSPESWLLVPEGNSKTTSMSGLALYHLEHVPYAMALWAASARDQAELGYLQAEGFVMRSQRLLSLFKVHPGYRRIAHRTNGSRLQIFAADDRTGDGVIPTLCLLDELHRHRNMKLYRTWRGKLLKRGGQLATFSTAGEPDSEFEVTREKIRQEAEVVTRDGCFVRAAGKGVVLHEWAVPEDGDAEDMELVKAANPFSAITVDQLREKYEAPSMTLGHWRRFVCNLPTRTDLAAVTEAEWALARVDDEIPPGEPIWLGVDLAFKWDTTAMVPLWWRDNEYRLLGDATILTPPRNGDSLDSRDVEDAFRAINERNPVHTAVVDRSKAEQFCQWIEDEFGCHVVERAQSNSLIAHDYAAFMEALREQWLKHTGDPGLTRHVLNATAKTLPNGDSRFERPAQSRTVSSEEQDRRVIDALSAASMVHSEAAAGSNDFFIF